MRAMAASARRKLGFGNEGRAGREPYDPMKIFARMAKYYGWSHGEMEQMHFVTFFAYVREANVMIEEKKREYDKARRGHRGTSADGSELQGLLQEAEEYRGETVEI